MADTPRDKSALATLFADNAVGAISPQDLRDFMEAMDLARGSLYISTKLETTIATVNTWTKAAGTTTAISTNRFITAVSNRLAYSGSPTIHCYVSACVSMTAAGNNKTIGLAIAKNGTVIDHSKQQRFVGTGTDVGLGPVQADVELATNDYLELFVANHTDATNLTIELAHMIAMGLFK